MTERKNSPQYLTECAARIADKLDADILLYNGDIEREWSPDEIVFDLCEETTRRENIVLILVTHGGSPHIAYRVARCLQRCYKKFTVFIPGICMSAGTLITVGADEIIMSNRGRLGPLDVQIYKADELYESASGLDVTEALDSLKTRTIAQFRATLIDLKIGSRGQITLRTAMQVATELTTGVFSPIYAQIDPIKLGENARVMRVAEEYAKRLDARSDNLQADALSELLVEYPSHGFSIDREEAENLFRYVRPPESDEMELADSLGRLARKPVVVDASDAYPRPIIEFISPTLDEKKEEEGNEEEEGDEAQDGRRHTEREREEAGLSPEETGESLVAEIAQNNERKRS